jgi:hypothetical protein
MRAKAALAVGFVCVAAVASSAAYLALVTPPEDTTRFVPADADAAARLNTTALAEEPTTDAAVEALLGVGYGSVSAAVRNETGLDARDLREVTVFGANTSDDGAYVAAVLRTDWTPDEVRDGFDGFEVDESSYNGVPFYAVRPNTTNATGSRRILYATGVARGVYVFGTEAAVRDASDVSWRGARPLASNLRSALRAAPVAFVATDGAPTSDIFPQVSTVSGAYRPSGSTTNVTVELRPTDAADTDGVRAGVTAYLTALEAVSGDRFGSTLERVRVTQTDSTVVVEHSGSEAETARTLRLLGARLRLGSRVADALAEFGLSRFFRPPDRTPAETNSTARAHANS